MPDLPPDLPPDWEPVVSEFGVPYYWNRKTNETTWERPVAQWQSTKRKRITTQKPLPNGCFLWSAPTQKPARRSTMTQYTDIFNVLLRRGMPASSPLTAMAIAHRIRQIAVLGLQVTADKASGEQEKSEKASPLKGKGKSKAAPATPEPSGKGKGSADTSKGKAPAADDATAGVQSGHTYFALETLVTCSRVCKTWRAALVTSGFDYGLATLGIAIAKWRVGDVDAVEGLRDDVDAPGELSSRLRMRLQRAPPLSPPQQEHLREVRQFLFRHCELSQKNATMRDDASAKPFLPPLLQDGGSWRLIFEARLWVSLAALEPEGSYLSKRSKGMVWALGTPPNLPPAYRSVVQQASDEVHVENEDEDSDYAEEAFVYANGGQIHYRQRGLDSKEGARHSRPYVPKKPKVETKVAEVKKGPQIGAGRGIKITAKPGGGDVGGSSSYKISNREATRDMDWLCAISSMEGTQHKTMRKTNPKPREDL